jgi:hypothetical protein
MLGSAGSSVTSSTWTGLLTRKRDHALDFFIRNEPAVPAGERFDVPGAVLNAGRYSQRRTWDLYSR